MINEVLPLVLHGLDFLQGQSFRLPFIIRQRRMVKVVMLVRALDALD